MRSYPQSMRIYPSDPLAGCFSAEGGGACAGAIDGMSMTARAWLDNQATQDGTEFVRRSVTVAAPARRHSVFA